MTAAEFLQKVCVAVTFTPLQTTVVEGSCGENIRQLSDTVTPAAHQSGTTIVVDGDLEEYEALGVLDIDGPTLEGKGGVGEHRVWCVESAS